MRTVERRCEVFGQGKKFLMMARAMVIDRPNMPRWFDGGQKRVAKVARFVGRRSLHDGK
jgi:hypothetical protein